MADSEQLARLKRSVLEWNTWWSPDIAIDLRDACLLADSLRGVILNQADLRGAILRGADLKGADLDEANLHNTELVQALLNGADLQDADLTNADLRGADLRGANLWGAQLSNANLTEADLRGANLMSVEFQRACLRDAKLTGADLTHANLEGVDLTGADLDGANLIHAYLSNVDLTGALGISFSPPPSSSSLISSNTHWRSLVVKAEENLLLGVATLSQVCEGLAALETQWRHYRPYPSANSALASSSPPTSTTGNIQWWATRLKRRLFAYTSRRAHSSTPKPEIVAITLIFSNTSPQGSTSRHIGDPLTLKNMLVLLNYPKNWVNLVRVMFEKRNGQQLVIQVVPNEQPPAACNVILGYAGIHTSCSQRIGTPVSHSADEGPRRPCLTRKKQTPRKGI